MKSFFIAIALLSTQLVLGRSIDITLPTDGVLVPSSQSSVTLKGTVDSVSGTPGLVTCNGKNASFYSGVNWMRAIPLVEAGPNLITCTYVKDGISASKSITVNWAGNIRPVSSFATQPNGLAISFDASSSYDADGTITNYQWSYGDGSTGTGINTTHSYTQAE